MKKHIVVFLLLFLCGCAVEAPRIHTKDGKQYGHTGGIFRERWYDYWQAALSYMEGDFQDDALEMLNYALAQRNRDQRMARTFGMHYTDYFPHREKGILLYLAGEDASAKRELELSLTQYPSAKARFYLDKVRISIMEREKGPRSAPRLTVRIPDSITDASGAFRTRSDRIILTGRAEDPQFVSQILVNSRPIWLESSQPSVLFQESLEIREGRHEISLTVRNLMGAETEQRIAVHADRSGPVISMETWRHGIRISGRVWDVSGPIRVYLNDREISLRPGEHFSFDLPPEQATVHLRAKDMLGNETVMEAEKYLSLQSSPILLARNRSDLLADTEQIPVAGQSPGPAITIKDWTDADTVFAEHIRMDIRIQSPSPIREIQINDSTVPALSGTMISHNAYLPLELGKNRIRIHAADENGHETRKEIRIFRKIPDAFDLHHRYCLQLHRFDRTGESETANRLQQVFAGDILNRKRFQLKLAPDLHKSADFSLPSAKTNPQALMLGMVHETRRGIEIAARLTDAATSEIITAVDSWSEKTDQASVEKMAWNLSESLHRKLPLADGSIIGIHKDKIRVKTEKWIPAPGVVKKGWPLMVYREINPNRPEKGSDTVSVSTGAVENPDSAYEYSGIINENIPETGTVYRAVSR